MIESSPFLTPQVEKSSLYVEGITRLHDVVQKLKTWRGMDSYSTPKNAERLRNTSTVYVAGDPEQAGNVQMRAKIRSNTNYTIVVMDTETGTVKIKDRRGKRNKEKEYAIVEKVSAGAGHEKAYIADEVTKQDNGIYRMTTKRPLIKGEVRTLMRRIKY